MAIKHSAGAFSIQVDNEGWPLWTTIRHDDSGTEFRVRAEDLADLAHIVDRARREAAEHERRAGRAFEAF